MTRKKKRSPFEVVVGIEDAWDAHGENVDPGHAAIYLSSASKLDDEETMYADWTDDELLEGWRFVAGVIARAAVPLTIEVMDLGRSHGCRVGARGGMTHGCLIEAGMSLVRAQEAFGAWAPEVLITVPAEYADDWLIKARESVAEVLASEAYQLPATHMAAPTVPAMQDVRVKA